jgi:hypothetical protein
LSGVSLLLFGPATWRAFIENIPFASDVLYNGGVNLLKMTTVSAALTELGVSRLPAQGIQAVVSLAVALYAVRLWRSDAPARLKYAGLCFGILLAAPFAFNYDLVIMGLGLLYLGLECQATGWRRWDAEVLLLGWVAPMALIMLAALSGVVLMPVALGVLMLVVWRRSRLDEQAPSRSPESVSLPQAA